MKYFTSFYSQYVGTFRSCLSHWVSKSLCLSHYFSLCVIESSPEKLLQSGPQWCGQLGHHKTLWKTLFRIINCTSDSGIFLFPPPGNTFGNDLFNSSRLSCNKLVFISHNCINTTIFCCSPSICKQLHLLLRDIQQLFIAMSFPQVRKSRHSYIAGPYCSYLYSTSHPLHKLINIYEAK